MTVSAWRIVRRKYQAAALSGEGAALRPGRWNSSGVPVVYTGGSISLAVLEMLVHMHDATTLPDYCLIEVRFDESLVTTIDSKELPADWRVSPPPRSLKRFGDDWIRAGASLALCVPSAITGEPNYLINPAHRQFSTVKIVKVEDFNFDARLISERLTQKTKPRQTS